MDRLANMIAFVTVAETGSFAETASRLRLANSVISKRIKDLEDYLGAQLLQRTTRRVNLTDAGAAYAAHARKFLDDLAEVEEHLRHHNENPVGDIKIAAPSGFANKFLGSAIASFLEACPDVTVQLAIRDRAVDIVAEGFDVVICFDAPSGEILAQSRCVVVAAPKYLDKKTRPAIPEDLARHDCIRYGGETSWPFLKDGKELHQKVNGRFTAEGGALLCEAAVRGCGIAFLPTFIAGPYIAGGALEILLQDFETEPMAICAVYQEKNRASGRVQKLVGHLTGYFKGFKG